MQFNMSLNFLLSRINRSGCPNCGHLYFKLYQTSRSTCPQCHEEVRTDVWIVRAVETIITLPILWLILAALRIFLDDSTGILSCFLLSIPAKICDIFVAQRFVTAYCAYNKLENGDKS